MDFNFVIKYTNSGMFSLDMN